MKGSRSEPNVMRRWYRPVEHECLDCHRTLRTVITLGGVIRLIGVCRQLGTGNWKSEEDKQAT